MSKGVLADERLLEIAREQSVTLPAGDVQLDGDLTVPVGARGVVLFAHGAGSSRLSPRNRHVAHLLQEARLATLLLDLLTREEETVDIRKAHLRFDIELLARRLIYAAEWLAGELPNLPVGCFGASTGGGGALVAAAERPKLIHAVVSRGGRPDLAGAALRRVQAPTLLIVGGNDPAVLQLNQTALAQLATECRLEVIQGASHLFEEPGALDQVARLAAAWFSRQLSANAVRR